MMHPFVKNAWTPADTALFIRALVGSAGVGAGVGAFTGLANHLSSLKDEAVASPEDVDSDVVKIHLPVRQQTQKKQAGGPDDVSMAGLASLVPAIAGGGAAGYGAISYVQNLLKKQELKEELTLAQRNYQSKLEQEAEASRKSASGPVPSGLSTQDTMEALALTGLTIPALASFVVANQFLNKQFPKVKPAPRGEVAPIQAVPEQQKIAAEQQDDLLAGLGLAVSVVLGRDKIASLSLLPDLVYAAAHGRATEIEDCVLHGGWTEDNLGLFKGAASVPTEPLLLKASAVRLASSNVTGPGFALLLAAEMEDMNPLLAKAAAYMPEADVAQFVKCAAMHERGVVAHMGHQQGQQMDTPEHAGQSLQHAVKKQEESLSHKLLAHGGGSQSSHGEDNATALAAKPKDIIDHALTGEKPAA